MSAQIVSPSPSPLNFVTLADDLLARWRWAELSDYHGLEGDDDRDHWSTGELAALRELAITNPDAISRDLPTTDLDGDPMRSSFWCSASDVAQFCADVIEERVRSGELSALDALDALSIECDRCDGEGAHEVLVWAPYLGDSLSIDTCERCNGTGDMGLAATQLEVLA